MAPDSRLPEIAAPVVGTAGVQQEGAGSSSSLWGASSSSLTGAASAGGFPRSRRHHCHHRLKEPFPLTSVPTPPTPPHTAPHTTLLLPSPTITSSSATSSRRTTLMVPPHNSSNGPPSSDESSLQLLLATTTNSSATSYMSSSLSPLPSMVMTSMLPSSSPSPPSASSPRPSSAVGLAASASYKLQRRLTHGWPLLLLVLLSCLPKEAWCGQHERRLLHDLLDNYNPLERPVGNESEPVRVNFGITLQQIMDVVGDPAASSSHHYTLPNITT